MYFHTLRLMFPCLELPLTPVVTGVCDPSKFQSRYHSSKKKKSRIDILHLFNKTILIAERKAHSTPKPIFAKKMCLISMS